MGKRVPKKSYQYHDFYENGRESSKKSKFSESRETEESVAGPIFHGECSVQMVGHLEHVI